MTFSQPEKRVNSLGSYYMRKLVFYKDKNPGERTLLITEQQWENLMHDIVGCWWKCTNDSQ